MIFHIPFKLDKKHHSGSHIRPFQMIKAFQSIGYDVEAVEGYARERRDKIRNIKNRIKAGEVFDFAYSESSTMPTALTEKHHLPIAPFLDFAFFRFLRKNRIRIGLFYRDIHWLFAQYSRSTGPLKRFLAKLFYRYDLFSYRLFTDHIYLPSISMAKYIPSLSSKPISELPPGTKQEDLDVGVLSLPKSYEIPLQLIYVGGMGKLYDLRGIVEVVGQIEGIFLTVSTRQAEWERNKQDYDRFTKNYRVVFHSGQEVRQDYLNSDIAVLFVKPVPYWEFVMPVKLFEYISLLLPVIGVQGTAAGAFISEYDIGWAIPYDRASLRELLLGVQESPDEIKNKVHNIRKMVGDHTWEARARRVAMDLG